MMYLLTNHSLLFWTFYILSRYVQFCCGRLSVSSHSPSSDWNDTVTLADEYCEVTEGTNGIFSLQLSGYQECNISIVSTDNDEERPGTVITITIIEANIKGTEYLYFENKEDQSSSRYVAFSGDLRSYKIHFTETVLSLYVRATVSLTIHNDVYQSGEDESLVYIWSAEQDSSNIRAYDKVIRCDFDSFPFMDDLMTKVTCQHRCLPNCSCTLTHRAIEMSCPYDVSNKGSYHSTYVSRTLIILPVINYLALYLHYNGLTTLRTKALSETFQGTEGIEWLQLDGNKLKILNAGVFDGLSSLGLLDLSFNGLTQIETGAFRGLGNLAELYLDYNNLTSLQSTIFRGLNEIHTLHICCNQLVTLPKDLFKDLVYLDWLSVANNKLISLDPFAFRGSVGGVMRLRQLAMQNNLLHTIPDELVQFLPNLTTLNLSYNQLRNLPQLSDLSHLKILDLRSNPLKKVFRGTFQGLYTGTVVLVDEPGTCCFIDTSQCNATNAEPPYLTCDRLLPHVTLRMFMWILGWSALLGNLLVLSWRCVGKMEEDKVQSLLISHLALSDMLTGIYMLILVFADIHFEKYFPSHAEEWRTGPLCKMAGVLALTSCEASVFFLTLISFDRFIRVVYPHTMRYRLTHKSAQVVTIILWSCAIGLGAVAIAFVGVNNDVYDISEVCIGLPLVRKSLYKVESVKYDQVEWFLPDESISVRTKVGSTTGMYFSIAIFLGLNLVCFVVVMLCYIAILKAVRDTSKRVKLARHRDREIKMAAKMFVIVATDFLCWVPIIITGILVQSGSVEISPEMFAWVVTFILPINSAVNPYLYTITTMMSKRSCRQSACTGSTGLVSEQRGCSERSHTRNRMNENGPSRIMLTVTSGLGQNGLSTTVFDKGTKV